jgi:Tfp pilus assembly protein PilW
MAFALLLLVVVVQVFLNMQDRQLALRGKSSWVQDYYMPAPCDSLVIAGAA